uniref:Uncharacterized protein n=1 Tax=Poecilia mexicana TaxID=48701 RepID=A0A3B3YWY3_9TELE
MCTTMMVLTTIAIILRQRFSNKIKPAIQLDAIQDLAVRPESDTSMTNKDKDPTKNTDTGEFKYTWRVIR